MPESWQSRDYALVLIAGAVSLSFLVLVVVLMIALLMGKLNYEVVGSVAGASGGGGLTALAFFMYKIIASISPALLEQKGESIETQ